MMNKPIAPTDIEGHRTAVSALVVTLRSAIVEGRLTPGARLNIKQLCASHGVSAIPMREALSRLTATGFVEARDQLGFSVAEVSAFDLVDITRARILAECEALRMALQAGNLVWESRLIAAHERLCKLPLLATGSPDKLSAAWDDAHMGFHHALLAACDSPVLLDWATNLRRRSTRYRYVSVLGMQTRPTSSPGAPSAPARDVHAEHTEMLECALRRDSRRGCDLLRAHYETTVKLALAAQPDERPAIRAAR